jgi:hypothetical protein
VAKIKRKSEGKSEPKPILRLRIEGPGIRKGRVPIPDLVLICEEAQKAINKQAEVLRNKKTIHPGPTAHSIQEDCTLELTAIRGNSPTILEFDLRKPQRHLDFSEEFGATAVKELAATINEVRRKKTDNNGFDPGVLLRLYSLAGAITPTGVSRISWITYGLNGHRRQMSAVITKAVKTSVAKKLSAPRKATVEVDGVLDMADFKPDEFKCRIDPPIAPPVLCTFDPQQANKIQSLLRQYVHVKGEATIRPYTDRIETLHIAEITPLSPMALADQSFFANPSLNELMDSGNVQPMDDPSILAGVIPVEDDIDEMLKTIYDARK